MHIDILGLICNYQLAEENVNIYIISRLGRAYLYQSHPSLHYNRGRPAVIQFVDSVFEILSKTETASMLASKRTSSTAGSISSRLFLPLKMNFILLYQWFHYNSWANETKIEILHNFKDR